MAGREYSFEGYFGCLKRIDYPDIKHIWMTNSENMDFRKKAKSLCPGRFIEVDDVPLSTNAFVERGLHIEQHAQSIAELYNRLYNEIDTEYFLFVEDDVMAPSNAIMGLLECYKEDNVGYACGTQMCRHDTGMFIWDLELKSIFPEGDTCREVSYQPKNITRPYGIQDIGLGHFGLTLLRKSMCEKLPKPIFKPRTNMQGGGSLVGSDIVLCLEMAILGYKRKCNFDVRGFHMDSLGRIH